MKESAQKPPTPLPEPRALLRSVEELREERARLQEAVRESRASAAEARRALCDLQSFLANLSHEIRTPLSTIHGMASLLLDEGLDADSRSFVAAIQSCCDALLPLVDSILEYSRIDAERSPADRSDFDLHLLMEQLCDIVAARAHEKGIVLALSVDRAVPSRLRGEPERLRQVLLNLAYNAIKFTEKGEVVARVEVEARDPQGVTLRFTVRDSGIGIRKENLARIFEPFAQEETDTSRRRGGSGLGLSISRRLVETMGGEIGVESAKGSGSTFWFTARLESSAAPEGLPATPPRGAEAARVLVADSHGVRSGDLVSLLDELGCRAERSATAEDARDRLLEAARAAHPFHMAFLESRFLEAEKSSWQEAARSEPSLRSTILVPLTPFGLRSSIVQCPELCFFPRLTLPVKRSQLLGCLSSAGMELEGWPTSAAAHTACETCASLSLESDPGLAEPSGGRILVAEDNAESRTLLRRILEQEGFRVEEAASGSEALRTLEAGEFDAVLMDVEMPDLDGLEATQRIRRSSSARPCRSIPIVGLTSHALPGDRDRCLAAGMDDYVSKPFLRRVLVETLRRRMSPASKAAELR